MKFREITSAEVAEKNVLVRVDYNVPLKNGVITATERIEASLKTIKFLLSHNAAVILCSHMGKPGGKVDNAFSLSVVSGKLEELLGQKVKFVDECIGEKRDKIISELKVGEVVLLENLRFFPGEEKNDKKFAEKLAAHTDIYVNDAFSESHREVASIVSITEELPSFAGFKLLEEVKKISGILENPKKPFILISGGAKISDKIEVLKSLMTKADVFILGGGMANTFLASEGYEVGKSLYEPDFMDSAEEISREAEDLGVELMLPDDVVVAKSTAENATGKNKSLEEVEKSDIIVDVGVRTVARWAEPLKFAGTIFWNGPIGINENREFAKGTIGLAKIVSGSEAKSVIGGGDTVSAVTGLDLKFDYISTGGGATLEFVAGKKLPGLEVLKS